jgi:hypothetical protein
MLTRSSINATAPLAQLLASRGLTLEAMPGSLLGVLVDTSTFNLAVRCSLEGEGVDVPQLDSLDAYAGELQSSSTVAENGVHLHDAEMETVVERAADAVANTITLARDVVNPQIEKIVSAATDAMEANLVSNLNPINIVRRDYSPLMASGLVSEIAAPYTEVRADATPLTVRIPMPSDEQLLDYTRTGVGIYDADVAHTLQRLGVNGLKQLWMQLFGGDASHLTDIVQLGQVDKYELAVLAMIIVQNVQQNPPAGVNMDVGALRLYLANLRAQLGQLLCRMPERRAADLRTGRLVVSAPAEPAGEVVVNGDVYQGYLEQGGTPEAIYGSLVNTGRVAPVAELIASRESFEQSWGRARARLQQREVGRRFQATVESFRLSVASIIADLPDEQLVVPRPVMHNRLDAALKQAHPGMINDLWGEARHLLCDTVYPHTQAETLLQNVDREAGAGDQSDMDEALIHAAADYIVGWACANVQQVRVTDPTNAG